MDPETEGREKKGVGEKLSYETRDQFPEPTWRLKFTYNSSSKESYGLF